MMSMMSMMMMMMMIVEVMVDGNADGVGAPPAAAHRRGEIH